MASLLVVEDQPELSGVLERHFTANGFEVTVAHTLAEARSALAAGLPDLVLLDVLLPDGTSYDLAADIRKVTLAPIIYLTALNQDDAIVRGLTAHGDDYITKPFSLDVLTARVNSHLRRVGLASGTVIDLDPLHIDVESGRVSLSGQQIRLTATELKLLVHFARHPGRGFSEAELLESVWGDATGVPTNTVRVHVSRLRRKLGLDSRSLFSLVLTRDKRYVFRRAVY
ncbi:MAG: response regulator transcription factor [Bifidobacteriaceae bacterium]|jgi:DNA-binding response OmpR family regulator|nr:response regulator transcription factor [Bifidobacteriaceae bacterium]